MALLDQLRLEPLQGGEDARADGGVLQASFLDISGLSGLACDATTAKVDLSDCTITLGPDAAATMLAFMITASVTTLTMIMME